MLLEVPELDTNPIWEQDKVDGDAMLKICNSDAARKLKDKWTELADVGVFSDSFADNFSHSKMSSDFFTSLDKSIGAEEVESNYATCRDKVAEFVAARSLYRNLRPNEGRAKVVAHAMDVVQQLEAKLPARLGLLMNEVSA